MRTQEEIVRRIDQIREGQAKGREDFFGVQVNDLVVFLDFEHARKFLNPSVTAETWNDDKSRRPLTDEAAVAEIKDYMPFAWEKANGCRGLSASRSMDHMKAWTWLLGLSFDFDDYEYYGKPRLVEICERPMININWRKLDNGRWRNDELEEGISADEALSELGQDQ